MKAIDDHRIPAQQLIVRARNAKAMASGTRAQARMLARDSVLTENRVAAIADSLADLLPQHAEHLRALNHSGRMALLDFNATA